MAKKSQYELEREANIAKNRALFEDLGLKQAVKDLGTSKPAAQTKAKPVQPRTRVKREREETEPPIRRQSRRLKEQHGDYSNETPEERKKREEEDEAERIRQEEYRLDQEEKARKAKRPRHEKLDFHSLSEMNSPQEVSKLSTMVAGVVQLKSRKVGDPDAFAWRDDNKHKAPVQEIREKVEDLKVVSRAKVTMNRIYCAAYHPDVQKDLLFFGDKHGQLGIWDATAPAEEEEDDGDIAPENREGGKYWRLQLHWPATPKSSISCIKVNPIDTHNIFTSSYDCTIRSLSLVSATSDEVYATENGVLITSIDLLPTGHEMWISDSSGGATHLDLREDKSKARRYQLSDNKIGSISVNPTRTSFLLTASNSRFIKVWDARKLHGMPISLLGDDAEESSDGDNAASGPFDFDAGIVNEYLESDAGKGGLRGEYKHDKSASSAYWDPRGRSIVSTSYDDSLRLWDIWAPAFKNDDPFPKFSPFSRIRHNCQTGKWLTILRAQWSQNPDVYPHFTVANMNHSLDIISAKGDLITSLSDPTMVSAVQAVTCSHPTIVERAASGNASGRCILWAPESLRDE